ncbi:MAG TPA: hypothetical protein ENK68_01210 [Epsilonproteobacteria bacterium]|nr:hypothetical protein [Campylobacterota bacterium]
MKKALWFALLSSLIFAEGMMDGWNNSDKEAAEKAQKAEQARMCTVYTEKIENYKKTMRDDELAQATLNNYVRLQTKYCEDVQKEQNASE